MKKYIAYTDFWGQFRTFEIVPDFPAGYQVWNIGRENFPFKKYIPLCEKSRNFRANPDTLKALKLPTEKQAAAILKAASRGTIDGHNFQNI